MGLEFKQKTPGRYSVETEDYELVFQWTEAWWKYPMKTWAQVDKGNFSIAFRLLWLEFIFFW